MTTTGALLFAGAMVFAVSIPTAALVLWEVDSRALRELFGRTIGFLFARRFTKP